MQFAGKFSTTVEVYGRKRFEPRCPKSKEDLLALTVAVERVANFPAIKGERCVLVLFVDYCNCPRNLSWLVLSIATTRALSRFFYKSFLFFDRGDSKFTRKLCQFDGH